MSSKLPALFAVVGVVVAVALFLVLKDDTADEDTTVPPPPRQSATGEGEGGKPEQPRATVIELQKGAPVGGLKEIEVRKGEEIRFVVRSDAAEEIHLHGYDVSKEVSAGGRVEFAVPATIEGIFEVELETSAVKIAEISVVPG